MDLGCFDLGCLEVANKCGDEPNRKEHDATGDSLTATSKMSKGKKEKEKGRKENPIGNTKAKANLSLVCRTTKRMTASNLVAEIVWKEIESTCLVTNDQLSILHFLFGKNLERATKIIDQRGVKRIFGEPSGRNIFQVMGESRRKEEYMCFPENYCACYSFFYDIVNRGEHLCCKHQLAVRLAASLGICVEVKVSDEQLALQLVKL